MSGRRDDSRRHSSSSRRDRSESSHRRDRDTSGRRSSPSSSRVRSPPPKPRDENELPEAFGRSGPIIEEDETTVLKRMHTAFSITPLNGLAEHLNDDKKIIKVWTRNYKEIRGITTGTLVAFDKHWNILMSDVEDVYFKPKKTKTPYLLDAKIGDNFPELPPKVPKIKKKKDPEDESMEPQVVEPPKPSAEKSEEKKKKRDKKQKRYQKRHLPQLFIRGDNIVMISSLTANDEHSTDALLAKR
ncbi:hypothetical protein NPIL_272861 [Nephila pilipes]|uniref:Sm domain-containing protein n=1 Tax=Nephila pilipes TaxID=299642 RepID=A0A8X6QV40_NEPPI|nr:hypothetical protein NPIL_272861 [Nephila pilipes]